MNYLTTPRLAISLLLSLLLCVPPSLGQDAAPPKKLKIHLVEGEESINNVRQRVAREPIVQVEDENRKPVAGAVVVFFLPSVGSGASFPNGATSLTVVTDEAGRAVARGLVSNGVQSKYNLRVTASYQGSTGSQDVKMTNAGPVIAGVSPALVWTIVAAAAGAAVAGVLAAAGSGGGSAPPITPGPPVVTPPR